MNLCCIRVGDIVAIEGVVMDIAEGEPIPRVVVDFPFASDTTGLLDGVRIVTPQVSVVACYHGQNVVPVGYTACEGLYEEGQ